MKKNNLKQIGLSLVVILLVTGCGSSDKKANPVASPKATVQPTATATPQPTKNPTVSPKALDKPIVSNVPKSTVKDEVIIELKGEPDATVWVNKEDVATINSEGKVNITLDTSGEKGSKIFSIVLKNDRGAVSEPLVILVEKKDLPNIVTYEEYDDTPIATPTPTLKKGVLIDSLVVGVTYRCGSKIAKTDENGTFECSEFPAIFTVADGKIEIGRVNSMPSDSKVYIQDLAGVARDNFFDPKVLKRAKLLQSLDDDGNYDTAIKIDDSAIALSDAKNIDDLSMREVETILTSNGLSLVSDNDVVYHLIDNSANDINKTLAKDKYDVSVDKEDLNISDGINIINSLTFPTTGANGSTYTYSSTDKTLISTIGVVARPSYLDGNGTVTITATISKGEVNDTKLFLLNVVALPITDLESVTLAKIDLNIAGVLSAIDKDIVLATTGLYGTTVSWVSSSRLISSDGTVTRPSFSTGNRDVELVATISKGSESVTKIFNVTVLKLAITDAEIVANVKKALGLGDTSALGSNLTLPTEIDGVIITWSSSNDAISSTGVINPDNYEGADKTATLTATLTKGAVTETKEFVVTVPKMSMTDAEAIALEKKDTNLGLVGDDLLEIVSDITLPLSVHDNGVTISWESNNTSIISNSGVVHRPSYSMGSTGVKLRAKFTKGSASDTKEFTVYVRPLDMTGDEMIADGLKRLNFNDIKGTNSTKNNIMANLVLPSNLIVDNGSNVLIRWESNSTIIAPDGTMTPPSFATGDQSVRVTATIGISDGAGGFDTAYATQSKSFDLVVKALDLTDAEAVERDTNEVLNLFYNKTTTEDIIYPKVGTYGSSITILRTYSDNEPNNTFIGLDGKVSRPTYTEGNKSVTIVFEIRKGDAYIIADTDSLIVIALPISDSEAVQLAYDGFSFDDIKGENSSENNITSNLTLPDLLDNGVDVVWSSDNGAVNATTGAVAQPSYTEGSQ